MRVGKPGEIGDAASVGAMTGAHRSQRSKRMQEVG